MLLFKGNFIEVCKKIGLAKNFAYHDDSEEEYKEQVKKDISLRERLVSFNFSRAEIVKKLSNIEELEKLSFTQGNFTAAVFAEFSCAPLIGQCLFPDNAEETNEKSGFFSFYFVDKSGKGTGVSFGYLWDPIENKYLYSIALIEDPHLEPENRKVTWFIDPKILKTLRENLPKEALDLEDGKMKGIIDLKYIEDGIPESSLSSSFNKAISSKELREFLNGIVTDEGLNIEALKKLKNRILGSTVNKHNIDSYELKNELFSKFLNAYPKDKIPAYLNYINYQKKESGNNFWHDDYFENHCLYFCEKSLNNSELTTDEKKELLKTLYAIKIEYLEEVLTSKGKENLLEENDAIKNAKDKIRRGDDILSEEERKSIDQYFKMWCLPHEEFETVFESRTSSFKRNTTEFIFERLNMLVNLFGAFARWIKELAAKKSEESVSLPEIKEELESTEKSLKAAESLDPEGHYREGSFESVDNPLFDVTSNDRMENK